MTDRQTTIDWIMGAAAAHLVLFAQLYAWAPPAEASDTGRPGAATVEECDGMVVMDHASDSSGGHQGMSTPACVSGGGDQIYVTLNLSADGSSVLDPRMLVEAITATMGITGATPPPAPVAPAASPFQPVRTPAVATDSVQRAHSGSGGVLAVGVLFGVALGLLGVRLSPSLDRYVRGDDASPD